MIQVFLKFPSKEVADGLLATIDEHSLDVIGIIYEPPVVEEGAEGVLIVTTPPVAKDGYHVNALLEEVPEDLLDYVVTPVTPSRVFAGWEV